MKKYLGLILFFLIFSFYSTGISQSEKTDANRFKQGNYVDSGLIKGGEIADGLDVKNIRWANRGNFERLVFDIYKWGGPTNPEGILPNDYPGTFTFEFLNEKKVQATFDGYRAFTAQLPTFEKSELVNEIIILRGEEDGDDSSHKIKIIFKKPVTIEVFELYSPARIVVDVVEND